MRQVQRCRGGRGGLAVFGAGDHQDGRAILKQLHKFCRWHTPVERNQNGTQLGAGEQEFEELDAIAAQDRHAVALRDAAILKHAGSEGAAMFQRAVVDLLTGLDDVEGNSLRIDRGTASRDVEQAVHVLGTVKAG